MGLLNYSSPRPAGEDYLAYYRDYLGPRYTYQTATPATEPTQPKGYSTTEDSKSAKDTGSTSGGYGEGQTQGEGGYNSPSRGMNALANLAVGSFVPGYGLLGAALGENPIDSLGKNVDMGASYMGVQSPVGAMQSKAAMNALNAETLAQAQAYANSNAFSDAYGGNFADAISASGPLGDAPMSGTWGGGGDYGAGGALSGDSGGASQGNAESGMYRNGGTIRPKRGLLDHEDDSMMGVEPVYGLLDGPKTKQRDNIPAVNVKTGEKIAVETDERIVPRGVSKKDKKTVDKIISKYQKGKK